MAFDAATFKKNFISTLPTVPKQPVTQPINATPAPATPQPKVPSFVPSAGSFRTHSQGVAQSTSPTPTGPDTKDLAVSGIKILNPFHSIPTRPLFARAGEEQPLYGGGLIVGAHDVAARTIEGITGLAYRTLANAGQALNKGKSTSLPVPFDTSRLGMENPNPWKQVGADMDEISMKNLVADYKRKGINAVIKPDFETEKNGVYIQDPSHEITDTGTAMVNKFDELQKSNPGKTKTNIVLASLVPVSDALNAFVAADLATSAANQVLRATRFTPDLDFALQTYGLKNSGLTGADFTNELTLRFNKKAAALIKAGDMEGLDRLGQATNIILTKLTGRGIPKLNRIGQFLENTARTALQDSKYGFHLQHPMYPEIAPEGATAAGEAQKLPGTREVPGQAMPMGMSTRRMENVGGTEEPKSFEGFSDLSTKLLDDLKGKTTVSKQYILDATNRGDLKQPERDLFRALLESEGAQVNVKDFSDKVRAELLPLERGDATNEYESVVLPDEIRGPIAKYSLHTYESPIKTSASDVHFGNSEYPVPNYFGHTRVEDLPTSESEINPNNGGRFNNLGVDAPYSKEPTRRVIEVQSDLFQKGRLENEGRELSDVDKAIKNGEYKTLPNGDIQFHNLTTRFKETPGPNGSIIAKSLDEPVGRVLPKKDVDRYKAFMAEKEARNADVSRLEPYKNNAAHFRMIREEVKQAAKDGKTKLQFPTGETAMKIEGLGENVRFVGQEGDPITVTEGVEVGQEVHGNGNAWIVTDVLGDGKFKAVPKGQFDRFAKEAEALGHHPQDLQNRLRSLKEEFDISGKVDTESPIYKFYEKTVGKYLSNKYGATRITDPQGQSWWEVPLKEEHKNSPVDAYGLGAGIQPDDDKNKKGVKFNPFMAVAGLLGAKYLGPEFRGLSNAVLKELAETTDTSLIRTILVDNAIMGPVADALAPAVARANTPQEVQLVVQKQADLLNPKAKEDTITVFPTDEESLNVLAQQQNEWKPALDIPLKQQEVLDDDLASVFADLKGIDVAEFDQNFTPEELDHARMAYEFVLDTLLDHPGRALMKYVSRSTGELPEFTGKPTQKSLTGSGKEVAASQWTERGDQIFQDLVGQELSKGGDVTVAQKMVDDYRSMKKDAASYRENLRTVRNTIRLQKAKKQFIESSKRVLARQVAHDVKSLNNLVEAAKKAGYREGFKKARVKLDDMVKRLKSRRAMIGAIKHEYDLTPAQMRDINEKDSRFMTDKEFTEYHQQLQTKAAEQHEKNVTRQIIDATTEEKNLQKTENLRHAMELPPLAKMTLTQLQEFENALAQAERNDVFLGPRLIQTIENTDLAGAKTVREMQQALARETGTELSDLKDVKWQLLDDFSYDAALTNANPLYKYMVTSVVAKDVENAQKLQAIRHKLDTLATAARKSVPRTLADKLVPQDQRVFQWLSTSDEEQEAYAKLSKMTPQELEYAQFVKELFRGWRDRLIEKGTLKKWREAYITHTTRSFFEQWKDDGFMRALGGVWKDLTDQRVDFDAFGDTGQVLGLEKFFKFSLPRSGNMKPSQNVAKAVLSYASSFYKKDALDAMIPKLEAYTFALQRAQGEGMLDPTGVNIDGRLRQFVRRWVNNKKGRRRQSLIPQGGKLDASMRAFKLLISLLDLGVNVISQTAQVGGAVIANFAGLDTKAFIQGAKRSATKQGIAVLKKYPGVVGEVPYERLMSSMNDIGDTFTAGAFVIMSEVGYRAKGQYFLGSLTKGEFESGTVSPERQAEIKLDMARFHPMEDMESINGATPEGKLVKMYKTWAVPLLFTASRGARALVHTIKEAESLPEGVKKASKTREVHELFKLTVGALGAYLFWQTVFGTDDPSDKSPGAAFKRRIAQELTSSLSALDPNTWLSVRPLSFAQALAKGGKDLLLAEAYTSNSGGHAQGDLKGVSELGQLLTPAIVRQALPGKSDTASRGSSSTSTNPALKRLDALKKSQSHSNPALERLRKLRKQGGATNPALQRLKNLRSN